MNLPITPEELADINNLVEHVTREGNGMLIDGNPRTIEESVRLRWQGISRKISAHLVDNYQWNKKVTKLMRKRKEVIK